jgi:hypothetical protein
MRKLYLLLCLSFITLHSSSLLAANITWTGSSGGNWGDASNWTPATVPGAADNVTFNTSVTVNMNGVTVNIASLNVTNNSTVLLSSNGLTDFNVSAASNALLIGSGSTLQTHTVGDVNLHLILLSGASGTINGTLQMDGDTNPSVYGSSITVNSGASLAVNGTITLNPHGGVVESTTSNLTFNAGSNYIHNEDGGVIPLAIWNATSTIQLTGTVENTPTFTASAISYGNVLVNLANLASDQPVFALNLFGSTTIQGYFKIINTNGSQVSIISNASVSPNTITVNNNFEISGNSVVQLAYADGTPVTEADNNTLQVNGNFVQSSGTFSLQGENFVTGINKLALKGNFSQTGGTFGATSTATSSNSNLFVLEFNGTSAQTLSTSTGTIDNAANMVTLRMNNTSGGVSLSNALTVGTLDLTSGVLTTNVANTLTVNNTSNTLGVTNASSASYISGPVFRKTNAASSYSFPTGKGGTYHAIVVVPNSTTASTFSANYFNTANGSPFANPLTSISNTEYWQVNRVPGGSDAAVQISLAGTPVAGAVSSSQVVVASFNGSQWVSALGSNGTAISPGNAVNGTATSDVQSNFNMFTFGVIGGNPLPILLLDFTATKSGSSANLNWKVDPVDIPQTVEILKSNNGRDFTKVGAVPGIEGVATYNYTDALSDGNNYYRLRLIDKDGSVMYSKVAAILSQPNGFAITSFAPTLVTRSAKLSVSTGSGGTMDLYITDMSGKVWRKFGILVSTGNNEQQLDLSDLSAGVYQIFGYMNGERTGLIRFVKQ